MKLKIKKFQLGVLVFFVCHLQALHAGRFECAQNFSEVQSHSQNLVETSSFNTIRVFSDTMGESYTELVAVTGAPSLRQRILNKATRIGIAWLDLGAGQARAIAGLLRWLRANPDVKFNEGSIVGLSYDYSGQQERIQQLERDNPEFNFFATGMYETWRQRDPALYESMAGQVHFFTDIYGMFSYTTDIQGYVQSLNHLLSENGEGFIVSSERSLRVYVNGTLVSHQDVTRWLEVLSGGQLQFTVVTNRPSSFTGPARGKLIHVTRRLTPIEVPRVTAITRHTSTGKPPVISLSIEVIN